MEEDIEPTWQEAARMCGLAIDHRSINPMDALNAMRAAASPFLHETEANPWETAAAGGNFRGIGKFPRRGSQ